MNLISKAVQYIKLYRKQEGKALVGKEKLGDTRQVTKAKKKSAVKRPSTAVKVADEGNIREICNVK